MKFKQGDYVTWTSQAGGKLRSKSGQIVHVLPPKGDPVRTLYDLRHQYNATPMTNARSHMAPDYETYFVLVQNNGEKSKIYYPRVQNLKLDTSLGPELEKILRGGL